MTYICVCDEQYKPEQAFAFIESIKNEFLQTISKATLQNATSYSLNSQFQDKLRLKMEYYEKNSETVNDEVSKLKKALIDEKNVVLEVSEVLRERGEKVELIVKKAETLTQESNTFYKSARNVYRAERRKKIMITIALAVVILLVIYLICGIACGWGFEKC